MMKNTARGIASLRAELDRVKELPDLGSETESWSDRDADLDELENLRNLEDMAGIEKASAKSTDDDEDLDPFHDEN